MTDVTLQPVDRCARSSKIVGAALAVLVALLTLAAGRPAQAQTYDVLHNFGGRNDGAYPQAGLTPDRAGNFYGTTTSASDGHGLVFKMTSRNGSWVLTPLYAFQGYFDGNTPYSSVTIGPDGNLYGTTYLGGGTTTGCPFAGCGTVYKLTPPPRTCHNIICPWTETLIYTFNNSPTALNGPYGSVIFDSAGNIYGTVSAGGTNNCGGEGCGAVYKLIPSGNTWTLSVLYNFTGQSDGSYPSSTLAFDAAGNLYGTTSYGAGLAEGNGAVFELIRSGAGWSEKTLYTFQGGSDGGQPYAGVILDAAGNLYGGTTEINGLFNGVIFELERAGSDWNYNILATLPGGAVLANLNFDTAGNLYGTTPFGGANHAGEIFELTPNGGSWTVTDLHDCPALGDGSGPWSTVVFDASGNLYGTMTSGGTSEAGVVWKITP